MNKSEAQMRLSVKRENKMGNETNEGKQKNEKTKALLRDSGTPLIFAGQSHGMWQVCKPKAVCEVSHNYKSHHTSIDGAYFPAPPPKNTADKGLADGYRFSLPSGKTFAEAGKLRLHAY